MAGRKPQGVNTRSSKASEESVKNTIREYLSTNIAEILQDIDQLPPKERTVHRMKLLDYVMPKVQAVRSMETSQQTVSDVLLDEEADD